MRNKNLVTMREAIFYKLYVQFRNPETRENYIPVHEFQGEIWVEPLSKWGYVSYECSARCSEINRDNPMLIERELLTGKSGATYYGYRLNLKANASMILDANLQDFYKKIRV